MRLEQAMFLEEEFLMLHREAPWCDLHPFKSQHNISLWLSTHAWWRQALRADKGRVLRRMHGTTKVLSAKTAAANADALQWHRQMVLRWN